MSTHLRTVPVSIILCTGGRSADLRSTLASLARVAVPPNLRAELVVVENGLRGDAEWITDAFPSSAFVVRYVFEPARGKSRALNRGIRESSGAILLFSDDDIRFPVDWIERMCAPILADRAEAVAGGVVLASHLLRPWMNHTHRAWLASTADYLSPDRPSEMCGANMAVTRRALEQIGGFDFELGPGVTNGGEESLISWQIQRCGWRIEGALDVAVEHHFDPRRLQYGSWLRCAWLKGQTRAYLMHHWFHRSVRFPALAKAYFAVKLALRRIISPKRKPENEGIAPWELSYVQDLATCAHFVQERRRVRNYSAQGLRQSATDGRPVAA